MLVVRVRGGVSPERIIEVPGRVDGTQRECDQSVRVQTVALLRSTDAACMSGLTVHKCGGRLAQTSFPKYRYDVCSEFGHGAL